MRNYENLVIVKPTLTAEEIQQSLKAVEEVITSNGGEIATTDSMGMRKLAYPIEKNERGYFHVIYYSVAPSAINEIERRFRLNEELLRFITIKYDTNKEIIAFKQLVQKAQKKIEAQAKVETPVKAEEKATEEVKAEEAPATEEVKAEEAPATETPAAPVTPAAE
ncbi:MAG: 30S ribosomal protein S6 [Sulfurimonas sp.]|nr:MAG: 30S ribosomal protein S6 [Sulfurimonas sp.]